MTAPQLRTSLADPDPTVRRSALVDLRHSEASGPDLARQVLPLLGDPDPAVRQSAVWTFADWGAPVVTLLQAVRRDGPGAVRAGALEALAEIGGEAVLSPRDVAAVERLARVRLSDDRPVALNCCYLSWLAVRTGDQAGLMDLLDLSAPRPVPFAAGVFAADCDSHGGLDEAPLDQFRRVFVTPELAGWTLVVGAWSDPVDSDRADEVLDVCARLSVRYGHAQAYWHSYQNDGSAVLVAERGTVLRRFAYVPGEDTEDLELGGPLPYEHRRRAELGLPALTPGRVDTEEEHDLWTDELIDLAPNLAAELSLNPRRVNAGTPSRGTGVLALTAYGRTLGSPVGALRL
ncbi:HEAT repeat domain-containing protein [Kitasatospora sp. NPDC049285]|uniref:HEAT repeat domain-containing protein n=1 Tax=Kitasatospora sp. NPDC049285 TaxID=3157096 RepID=UPI00342C8D01